MSKSLRPPVDVFHSDRAESWPRGLLPKLRPRPRDPDAPPTAVRPGEGYCCPHELLLDRLTVGQAERIATIRGWSARLLAGMLPDAEDFDGLNADPGRTLRLVRLVPAATHVVRVRFAVDGGERIVLLEKGPDGPPLVEGWVQAGQLARPHPA